MAHSLKIVGIIPSRYASTRLPAKSLADICGKPMVQHVYERAKQSLLLTDVIVATDDGRIESAVKRFGGNVVMTPTTIRSGSDRIAYAAQSISADIIVNIQGDEPLIEPRMIDQTISILLDDAGAVVSTAVKRIVEGEDVFNPNIVKVVFDKNNYALYFSRSPIPYVRDEKHGVNWVDNVTFYKHFGIYVYRTEFLKKFSSFEPTMLERSEKLEQLRILENGFHIKVAVTEFDSVAVDTPEDLERVREKVKTLE
ncbi:MAG: 3-deoxy-manno-octulosonate cytidylyltransferase [Bacteroidota bacterium]|nr:3-deoxy-manno-octulosonate cytidylyltransferase [Bacteroidota bacterium]